MNKFPENFLWGSATSSHQVEGNNTRNDWWEWEEMGRAPKSGLASDHYKRFREDFRIAKDLGHNAHRFSIEWSRVEKNEGEWDNNEWNHYREVIDELVKLNIEPILTINHFTVPIWFARKGGWGDSRNVEYFVRFAEKAVHELGSKVKYWITINEPLVLAFIGYFQGIWPPGEKDFSMMMKAGINMLRAHNKAYVKMKEASPHNDIKIGIAMSVATFHPCSYLSIPDRMAAFLRANFQNHAFIRSSIKGRASFFPYINEKLPYKKTIDFIGLNYYFREFVHHKWPLLQNPFGHICSKEHHLRAGERTTMGWEIYPKGIYEVVKSFSKYKLPIMITEHGLSTYDDNIRKSFIKEHLFYLLKSINEGANVIGYLHWSLLDNFEWAEGFGPRFGLVEVDYNTQKRLIRESARYYSSIIRKNSL